MDHSILYQHPPPPIEGNPRGREGAFSSNFWRSSHVGNFDLFVFSEGGYVSALWSLKSEGVLNCYFRESRDQNPSIGRGGGADIKRNGPITKLYIYKRRGK